MDGATKDGRLIRFSVFELDRDSGELFKQGRKVKLPGQPFELLVTLLERPGEVLTREELRQRIWPSDTSGDFDHGLNRAVNKVREALGDSAETPRFIETLPRRGYRFIGAIQHAGIDPVIEPAAPAVHEPQRKPRRTWIPLAIAAAFVVAGFGIWALLSLRKGGGPIQVQQLTTNSAENPVWQAVISPDGKYLAYGDLAGIQVRLISTGESHLLPTPPSLGPGDLWFPSAWLPDGTRLLATSITSNAMTAWTVSMIGGKAVPLRENARLQSVSPDGSLVAFTTGSQLRQLMFHLSADVFFDSEIWVMRPNGENARRVMTAGTGNYLGSVRWSPDGKRLGYQKLSFAGGIFWDYSIESRRLDGRDPAVIISDAHKSFYPLDLTVPAAFWWLPDGRIIYAARDEPPRTQETNIWQVEVEDGTGKPRSRPQRLTNLAGFNMEGFSADASGKKLIALNGSTQSHVLIAKFKSDGTVETPRRLTTDERTNNPLDWTRDSQAVIFTSDRTGAFRAYKQSLNQSVPELITTGGDDVRVARVSPDGESLLYSAVDPSRPADAALKRVSLSGGVPQFLFKTSGIDFSCPRNPGAACVGTETFFDTAQKTIFSFDARTGARREVARMGPRPYFGTLSPDGTRLAVVDGESGIEIHSVGGEMQRRIDLRQWAHAQDSDWAADNKSLFISHPGLMKSPSGPIGVTILRVDLDGRITPLWETRAGRTAWAIASPDGKYLAICEPGTARNAWMIENF